MAFTNPFDYSETAGNNTSINGISLAEGMNPSAVNNAIRELHSQIRKLLNTIFASATSSGTDTITLTTSSVLTQLEDGVGVMFIAGGTNTGAVTFAPDGLTAKAVVKSDGSATALSAGDIVAGMPVFVVYDASVGSGSWLMLNPISGLASYLQNISEDASPQLGAALDAAGFNIGFDDATGITDDSSNEQLIFQKTASAVNYVEITNAATGTGAKVAAAGSDTDVDLILAPQASGVVDFADAPVKGAFLYDYGEKVNALGSISGANNMAHTSGSVVTMTITGATTLTWTAPPASGRAGSLTLIITNGGSNVTITNGVQIGSGGATLTLTAAGVDIVTLLTINAASTVYIPPPLLDFG